MRAGEMLGMSAGEERSALAGGGWANLACVFVCRRRRRRSILGSFKC